MRFFKRKETNCPAGGGLNLIINIRNLLNGEMISLIWFRFACSLTFRRYKNGEDFYLKKMIRYRKNQLGNAIMTIAVKEIHKV